MVQVLEPLCSLGESFLHEGLYLFAWDGCPITKIEQGCDIVEGEACRLGSADES